MEDSLPLIICGLELVKSTLLNHFTRKAQIQKDIVKHCLCDVFS